MAREPLTKEEVLKIAALSKLELTDEQVETYRVQLSAILSYVDELQAIDTEDIVETAQVTGLENVWRDDKVNQATDEELEDILSQAPDRVANLIRVKSVFSKDQ